MVNRNILPALGKLPVVKLTPQRLRDWHRGLAERARYWRSRKSAAANLAPFDPKDAEDVRRRRASANRVLTYLKAALNLAWRNGLVPSDDAWRRVKPFRSVEAPLVRYLSNDEMVRLRGACASGFRDLVYLALLTGCRYGELCRFKVADLPCGVGSFSSLCSRVSGTYVVVAGRRTSPEATRPAIRPPRIAASVPATGTGISRSVRSIDLALQQAVRPLNPNRVPLTHAERHRGERR